MQAGSRQLPARRRRPRKPVEAFMNAASPGVIALFQPNDYYPTQDAYLEAIAEAMRAEYEAIVGAGFLLQIDAPDLGMGRHTMYRDASVGEYLDRAARHVEVLNHALRNMPADRLRMHICWGNYEGPHHHDVPLEQLLPVVIKARSRRRCCSRRRIRVTRTNGGCFATSECRTTRSWFRAC